MVPEGGTWLRFLGAGLRAMSRALSPRQNRAFVAASPREGSGGGASTASGPEQKGAASAATTYLLALAAACGGAALCVAGYYMYTASDGDDGEGSVKGAKEGSGGSDAPQGAGKDEEDQASSQATLTQAREALRMEWEQAEELNKASDGKLGFEAWWTAADGNSKKALLQSARDLMRQRLLEHQPEAATALDVLCPEIGDNNLDKLVRGFSLLALIRLRISQIDVVRKHDLSFVQRNMAKQHLEGFIHGVPAAEVLCDNRQLLLMTFLCDVLILCRHMGNFPKMLSERNPQIAQQQQQP